MKTQERSSPKTCRISTLFAADSLVRVFQSLESEGDLKMPGERFSLRSLGLPELKDLSICSLKTFPDCYLTTAAGRLRPSSVRFRNWGTMSHGRFLTAQISVFPNPEKECFLSAVLEKNAPERYRACGWVFLVMNLALSLIVFFMVYWNKTFEHHMITAIAMAAYTFTALTMAIINVVKYKKYNSPVFSASRVISLAAALVSMLTLESTMLTTFRDETMTAAEQKWMLGATGGVISVLIVATAIYMIVTGTKKLKQLKSEVENGEQ